jgi:hypothetical protein
LEWFAEVRRWRGLVEKIADARPVILAELRAGLDGVRAAEPAQAKAGGRRKPTDTVPSRRRDLGVDVRSQCIFDRAAEPAQAKAGGRRKPTDTVPSRRRDLGVDVRAQRIFASLPGGRRKATVRRDLGVHLLARGKMNSRFLRTGLGEANWHTLILSIRGWIAFPI